MSEIGDEVAVLRHPGAMGPARKAGTLAVLILLPIVAGILLMSGDFTLQSTPAGHLPLIAGLVMAGAYLVSALIALPGLLMIKREQLSEELQVGERGMRLVQTLPGAEGPRQAVSWEMLWDDVAAAKLRYRDEDAPYDGASIQTRNGMQQLLYARDWQLAAGNPRASAVIPLPVKSRAATLRDSDLVKILAAKGLKLDDDVPRPQDRLAAWLGLGLGAAAIIAALIFNYIIER